ncbi:MAG: hypothetical protein L0H37_03300, partial [Nitrosospira sp.]|nr:hypothetical protein [Nitrosospira sp.]
SGLHRVCASIAGTLPNAKLARWKSRLLPDGLLGTHNGQRQITPRYRSSLILPSFFHPTEYPVPLHAKRSVAR